MRTVSGQPLLVDATRHAVAQWRFQPYVLLGKAVPTETTVTVNFKLPEKKN